MWTKTPEHEDGLTRVGDVVSWTEAQEMPEMGQVEDEHGRFVEMHGHWEGVPNWYWVNRPEGFEAPASHLEWTPKTLVKVRFMPWW